jgi:hypothetical protein
MRGCRLRYPAIVHPLLLAPLPLVRLSEPKVPEVLDDPVQKKVGNCEVEKVRESASHGASYGAWDKPTIAPYNNPEARNHSRMCTPNIWEQPQVYKMHRPATCKMMHTHNSTKPLKPRRATTW